MNPTTISSPKAWTRAGNASIATRAQLRRMSDLFIESPLSVLRKTSTERSAAASCPSHHLPPCAVRPRRSPGGARAGPKPATDVEGVSPENALRSKDHHQDDDAAPDLPPPVRQKLQRSGKVRDDERAEQRTVQHIHATQHHVHRDVDAALEVEVVVLDEHGMVGVQAAAHSRDERAGRKGR